MQHMVITTLYDKNTLGAVHTYVLVSLISKGTRFATLCGFGVNGALVPAHEGSVVDLLLSYGLAVTEVQAVEVYKLILIVIAVNIIKDLPCYVVVDLLFHFLVLFKSYFFVFISLILIVFVFFIYFFL